MKTYLTDFVFSYESENIEDVRDKAQIIMDYAQEQGFTLIDGGTRKVNEREPIESLAYSVGAIFRNQSAQEPTEVEA